ncbi:hypothetical protein WMY93_010013 [Mugilogobius chulae]|uniref:Uncharacterized protein n=1 Tax=Mugilogobius chulae TaxID=88201 RepID=A0AAW0PGK8_9GOBI
MNFSEVYRDSVGSVSAAARSGSLVRVRDLIRSGHSLDVRDNRGWTCLHEAAAQGHKGCVREILRAAASSSSLEFRSFVNATTHEGETAMFLAAQNGRLSVVKILLKAKADVNRQTNDLSCPLYAAVDGGHTEMVKLLILKGAEVNRRHTASCWTCLHQAVYKGHREIVSLLSSVCELEIGTITASHLCLRPVRTNRLPQDPYRRRSVCGTLGPSDGASPLLISSQEGHDLCVSMLLCRGSRSKLSLQRRVEPGPSARRRSVRTTHGERKNRTYGVSSGEREREKKKANKRRERERRKEDMQRDEEIEEEERGGES